MKIDALIRVRFLTSSEGGRTTNIVGSRYGCPLFVNGEGFDCRFVLEPNSCIELGRTYDIRLKLMNPDLALSHLKAGVPISLWEGRTIATGHVVSISPVA